MRDFYTCQSCKVKGGKIEAHHIKKYSEYPDLRTELSNGLTLCYECHNKEHGKIKREKTYKCVDCKSIKKDGRSKRCQSCAGKKRILDFPKTNPGILNEKCKENYRLTA